jgi:YdjC-like protein
LDRDPAMTQAQRKLVVNVDDAGFAAEGDRRILEAIRHGLVRSLSIAVTGETAADFLRRLRELDLPHEVGVGLHLDFVDGRPLGGPYRTLGRDLGDKESFWRRAATNAIDPEEVAEEARRQWERLCSWGHEPDHLDGHTHVQLFAPVLEGLARGLGDLPLHMRFPAIPGEGYPGVPTFPARTLDREQFELIRADTRWLTPLTFRGFGFSADPGLEKFERLAPRCGNDEAALASRSPLEVMVHFGGWAERPFLAAPQRELEFELLCAPATSAHLKGLGFQFLSFGELS